MKNTWYRLLTLSLALIMPMGLVSCVNVQAKELSAGYERSVSASAQMSDDFLKVMADFSLDIFQRTLTEDAENDLVSPLSAMLCLALVTNGADGETLRQIEAALGMDVETLNESLYAYTASLPDLEDSKLQLANSIWFRDDGSISVKEDFLQTNADWYDAQIYEAPFDNSTVKDVNGWVKKHTDGMIDSILDSIDPMTVMYLINTLVFDAKWQEEYEKKNIRDRTFYNADGSRATVDMMFSEENTYLEGEGFCGFSKNYMGGAYSFVGLLPDENTDVYDLVATLDGEKWNAMWSSRRNAPVDVGIPEFSYDAHMNMTETLSAMGMSHMFDAEKADFSKIGECSFGNIYCSSIEQKTFIDVSRHGTKAAAVTWGMMCGNAAPMETYSVILDRPFVYAIVDNATGLPVFLGLVSHLN